MEFIVCWLLHWDSPFSGKLPYKGTWGLGYLLVKQRRRIATGKSDGEACIRY